MQATFNILEVISEWLNVHMNILERWESRKYFGFNRIAQSAVYSETLASVLVINVPINGVMNAFISLTGMDKLDNLLNKVKERSLVILNYIFRFLFEKVANSEKRRSPFLPRALQFAPYLSQSLISVCKRPDFLKLQEDETFCEVLIEGTDTLTLFSGEQEFQDELVKQSKDLLVHVALTMMRTVSQEL